MQIACPSCKKLFALDDAKAPVKPVVMKCPACGGAIPVSPQQTAGAPEATAAAQVEAPARVPPPGFHPAATPAEAPPAAPPPAEPPEPGPIPGALGREVWEQLKHEVTMEVMRHFGVKTAQMPSLGDDEDSGHAMALVCESDGSLQVVIRPAVEKLGFKVDLAPTKEAAIAMLPRKTYEMVTVDSTFPDDPQGGYEILRTINASSSDVRREVFVAFISSEVPTLDSNLAFVLGANLTVAKRDLKRLDKILSQSLREHQKMYKVFHQVQEELERQEA